MYRFNLRIYLLLSAILMLFDQMSLAAAEAEAEAEDKLLLAYIYNLGKFIAWPSTVLAEDASINICFYGQTSFSTDSLNEKSIKNHPISTDQVARGGDLNHCHIVYIADSEHIYFRPILQKLQGKSILTISQSDNFIDAGGMVALVYSDQKLRFDIQKSVIDAANLKASSQILRLARKVTE